MHHSARTASLRISGDVLTSTTCAMMTCKPPACTTLRWLSWSGISGVLTDHQRLALVHFRAQLQQLQDTFMS